MNHPDFDALAPHYRWIEALTFGPLLQWCRAAMVPLVRVARRALVLGDGDGRFLATLLEANPEVMIDALDVSPGMTALARRRVNNSMRVRFHVADAETAPLPTACYDLVVTNFFLDCFDERGLGNLVPKLAAALVPGGWWIVGDFRLPTPPWARLSARALLATMYAFFRFATGLRSRRLVHPDAYHQASGLTLEHEETRLRGFLASRLWRKRM